ncbi:Uncharacterized conserved coiled-coil protein [Phaffia rhodozyma]|uniref:Uncharacterized conserved coiled-coil protein n=1 Tax=Phaffia rhodozyma TaxID=264483 RepID=A0A0F7STG2_PHARH|nr:Uncharacterized conserved coiled-coil protein [Phaffia rhodozyma]
MGRRTSTSLLGVVTGAYLSNCNPSHKLSYCLLTLRSCPYFPSIMDVDPPLPDQTQIAQEPALQSTIEEPSELEILKAEQLRKEVEQEQAVSDALAEVAELKAKLEAEKKKGGEVLADKQGLEQSLQHLQQSHSSLQQSLSSETSKATQIQTELSNAQNQNKSLLSTIESLQVERDTIKTEVLAARQKVTGWERRVGEVEGELEVRRIEGRNHKFKIEALELNVELANKDNMSLSDSLTRLTSEFAKYRSTSHAQNQNQALEIQSLQQSLSTAQISLKQIENSSAALQTRLTTSLSINSQLRTTVAEIKSNFKQEITAQTRMLESAERRSDEGRRRLEEVEREWEEDLERRSETEKRVEKEKELWAAQRLELESKVSELRDTIERLVEASGGKDDGDRTGGLSGASLDGDGAMGMMSPTASLANSLMRKKGQSVTDLYVENVRVKNNLVKQEAETRRLEDCLQEVLRDIQERAPLLKEQRQEYHRLVKTANELASQLSVVTSERDSQTQVILDLTSKAKQMSSSITDLESHISDLSRQIIALSREIAVRDDPAMVNWQDFPVETESGEEGDDMESIISRNLIIFRSIPELQAQNQKLIKIVRELGKKMEAAEAAAASSSASFVEDGLAEGSKIDVDTLQAIEEANLLIQSLQQKLLEKDVQMEKFIRERDLFSRMLSQAGVSLPSGSALDEAVAGGAGGAGGLLDVVKANLESYRKELGLDADRLREELATARKELGTISGSLARLEAERDFLSERIVGLDESNRLQRVQFEGMSSQNQTLKTELARVNMELRSAEDKRIQAEGVAERGRTDAANLRAEKELWKTIESRLQADLANLARERASLQSLTQNLQSVEAESAKVLSEAKARSAAAITALETERSKLRTEISKLKEEKVTELSSLTSERDSLKTAIETLTAELEAAKNATASENESRETTLRKAFDEEKEKYVVFERKRSERIFRDNKALLKDRKEFDQSKATYEAEIAQLKTQLSEVEQKLSTATSAAPQPASEELIAAAVAAKEAELQTAHSEALEAKEKEIQSAKEAAAAASASQPSAVLSEADEKFTALTSERDALVAQLASEKKAYEEEKAQIIQAERKRVQNVHTDNVNFRRRLAENATKEKTLTDKITELEAKLSEAEKAVESAPQPSAGGESSTGEVTTAIGPPSEKVIKSAVDTAVSVKEAELQAAHAEALAARERELKAESERKVAEAVKAAQEAAAAAATPASTAAETEAAIKTAVSAREAELTAAHEEALKTISASTSGPESAVSSADVQTKIDEAVAAALARAADEQVMKTNLQKTTIQRERKNRIKAETELNTLRSELEALRTSTGTVAVDSSEATATPSAAPTATAASPASKPGLTRPSKPRVSSGSSSTTTAVESGPAGRTRAAAATGGAALGSATASGASAATEAAVASPAIKGAAGGPSIRGAAAAGRGGASTRGARGGRAPTTLFAGALGKAQASGTGTKRARPEDDAAATGSGLGNTLFDRLNESQSAGSPAAGTGASGSGPKPRQQLIKRTKPNNPGAPGGAGAGGAAGDASGGQNQ